ncbi:UNVERIFIED_ORG: hypothetical protein ABIC97_003332 [Peribacillus simplex]
MSISLTITIFEPGGFSIGYGRLYVCGLLGGLPAGLLIGPAFGGYG